MKSRTKIYIGFVGAVILVPLLVFFVFNYVNGRFSELPYYGEDYQSVPKSVSIRVEPFAFVNQEGDSLNGDFVKGKVWVACYFFTTCPTICPTMISGMGDIQKEFTTEDQLRLVSFTVDPENDKPEVLKQYANNRDINTKQWSFLTGDKRGLYRYARKELTLMATDGDGGPQDFIHSDRLVLLDKENHIRGYYDGTEPREIKQLMVDIKKLL